MLVLLSSSVEFHNIVTVLQYSHHVNIVLRRLLHTVLRTLGITLTFCIARTAVTRCLSVRPSDCLSLCHIPDPQTFFHHSVATLFEFSRTKSQYPDGRLLTGVESMGEV